MTTFKLTIKMVNDAFQEGNSGRETARILREVADRVERLNIKLSGLSVPLRDVNGNPVGVAVVK